MSAPTTAPDDDDPGVEPTEFIHDDIFSHPVVTDDIRGDALLPAPDSKDDQK